MLVSSVAGAGDKYPFSIVPVHVGSEHELAAHNDGPAPVAARVHFTELQNAVTSPGETFEVVIPPHSERLLGKVTADKGSGYFFRFDYKWRLGDPEAVPDPNAIYRLPFGDGLSFNIVQGPGGPLSTHADGRQEWAVDLPMPVGTPIVAAREGVVAEVVDGFGEGGPDSRNMNRTNYVRVLHEDGTFATYAHLLAGSVRVQLGERVAMGAPLGRSGNSGFSSGPHLHFAVERNDGRATSTIPFRFYSATSGPFDPAFNLVVTADYDARESDPNVSPTAVGGVR